MRKTVLGLFILVGFLFFAPTADARSGCCSHHGGVCGCGCCDGSSLSTTCAPYYPECSSGGSIQSAPTYVVPATPRPATPKPTPRPTAILTPKSTPRPTSAPAISPSPTPIEVQVSSPEPTFIPVSQKQESYGFWSWLIKILGGK